MSSGEGVSSKGPSVAPATAEEDTWPFGEAVGEKSETQHNE